MKTKHTEGVMEVRGYNSLYIGGRHVAYCGGNYEEELPDHIRAENTANAKRLALAWNCHDEFRWVAKSVLLALSYPRGSEAQIRCLEESGQDAKAILAKATKGE